MARNTIYTIAITLTVMLAFIMWFGMNSDRDDVPPLLAHVMPAGSCLCQTSTAFRCEQCLQRTGAAASKSQKGQNQDQWNFTYERDRKNIGLSGEQCDVAFPGLFTDPDSAEDFWTSRGRITSQSLDQMRLVFGMARVIIFNGDLYVRALRASGEDHRRKLLATLSSIHRALTAHPNRHAMQNTEFVLSIEDKAEDIIGPGHPLWVLTRKTSERWLWLMPDFGFWAWEHPQTRIGPYSEVVEQIKSMESVGSSWHEKIPKLVWRGKLSFAPKLRHALLEATRGYVWADVKYMDWSTKKDFLTMSDHCKYAFIAHVEGRSYSASLKYRQACRSVVVMHKLQWIQHHHYLLVEAGPLQNYVEVERDFSDLPRKIQALIQDPLRAELIANNSVTTFRERYLTPAAEACYWRRLWENWASVSDFDHLQSYRNLSQLGALRYESFILLASKDMMEFGIDSYRDRMSTIHLRHK